MTQALTKSCPHCKATIDSAAKKCQHCQTDLRNWIVRHPVWTVILIIVIVPIFVSALNDTKQVHNNSAVQTTNAPQTTTGTLSTDEIKIIGGSANANDIAKRTLDSLSITSVKIVENSIGTPELYITVKNNGTKTIDAFTFAADLYNNFDEQLGEWNRRSNEPYLGLSQDIIKPGATNQGGYNLTLYDQTTKAKNPRIIKVHFTDGTGAELSDY